MTLYLNKMRNKKLLTKISILIATILVIGFALSGCIQGLQPIGWSGVAISDGNLFVGSNEGRLVSVKMADGSRQWSEPLRNPVPSGGLGCAPADSGGGGGGLGCGSAPPSVAIYGTPVLSGELVYIAGYNGKVYAFNAVTLQTRWVYPREGNVKPIIGGMVVSGSNLYFAVSDGKVYALDAATGDTKWESNLGDQIWSTPVISGNTLYIGSFDKKLYALDVANGAKKWEFQTEGSIVSTPVVYDGMVYFGSLDRYLYAISESDHSLKWKFMGNNWFWARPVGYEGVIYAPGLDNNVYLLDAKSGAKINEFNLESSVSSSPVLVDKQVVVLAQDGKLYGINKAEKKLIAAVAAEVSSPLTASKGIVYIHTPDLNIIPVDATSGAKLSAISLKKSE